MTREIPTDREWVHSEKDHYRSHLHEERSTMLFSVRKVVSDPLNQWYEIVDENGQCVADVEGEDTANFLLLCLTHKASVVELLDRVTRAEESR